MNGLPCDHVAVLSDDGQHFEAVIVSPPFTGKNKVQLLKACGVQNFTAVNVLADPEIRDGIKAYSSWPTVPQLYIKSEFIGGADIVRKMYEQGELQKLIQSALG